MISILSDIDITTTVNRSPNFAIYLLTHPHLCNRFETLDDPRRPRLPAAEAIALPQELVMDNDPKSPTIPLVS